MNWYIHTATLCGTRGTFRTNVSPKVNQSLQDYSMIPCKFPFPVEAVATYILPIEVVGNRNQDLRLVKDSLTLCDAPDHLIYRVQTKL